MMQPPIASQISGFSRLEDQLFVALPPVRHKSLTWTPKPMQEIWKERKSSLTSESNGETKAVTLLHEVSNVSTPSSWSSAEDSISNSWDDISSSNGLKSSSDYVQRKEDDHQVVCSPHQLVCFFLVLFISSVSKSENSKYYLKLLWDIEYKPIVESGIMIHTYIKSFQL